MHSEELYTSKPEGYTELIKNHACSHHKIIL